MKLTVIQKPLTGLTQAIRTYLEEHENSRLGQVTSIDGRQLIVVMLDPQNGQAECWEVPLDDNSYHSLTTHIPSAHWFERALWDLFGVIPEGHPRLKHLLLHEQYEGSFFPLRTDDLPSIPTPTASRQYRFLEVRGEGVYELPVGPVHAGVIEPGHFRFSCFGENILNLEIRLGYLHRGVEKRITELPWQKARFVAEATASDTAVGYALAHAIAIESIAEVEPPEVAQYLRSLALEIERIAVHVIDIGGIANDIGFLGVYHNLSRLRGRALRLGQILTGMRFMRGAIMPGGFMPVRYAQLEALKKSKQGLKEELQTVIGLLETNDVAKERAHGIGIMSPSLAKEFGLVGVAGRACGIQYDTRQHFKQGIFPKYAPKPAVEDSGDIWDRTNVRIQELFRSFDVVDQLLENIPLAKSDQVEITQSKMPEKLPANSCGIGIVEAFRGELIHLAFTNEQGQIKRYSIKDPSWNNWTAISIAIRNGLVADFPLCNKSLALSYSGNDL